MVLTGRAGLDPGLPGAAESAAYLAKYREAMVRIRGSIEAFSRQYSLGLRVEIDRVRGF